MGASAAYHLAIITKENNQPVDITVLEHSSEGVQRGGSAGNSRITRLNTRDVPPMCFEMIIESNKVAQRLGCARAVNALTIGNWPEKLDPAIESAQQQKKLRHEILDAARIKTKYPFINSAGFKAVDEEAMTSQGDGAGIFDPHMLIQKLLEEAKKLGVKVRYSTPVSSITEENGGVITELTSGEKIIFDKAVLAAGVWNPRMMGPHHPVGKKLTTTAEPLYLFKVDDAHISQLLDFPVLQLKVKGGEEFAREHPGFVKKYSQFARTDTRLQVFTMTESRDDGFYFKLGVCKPEETIPKDPDVLLREAAQVTDEQHRFVTDIITHFLPGVAKCLPGVSIGKADEIAVGAYSCAPDYVPIISPLRTGSNITIIAADTGISGKFAVESGKYAARYALGHSELIPEAARETFSIDRNMQSVAMPEQSRFVRISPAHR